MRRKTPVRHKSHLQLRHGRTFDPHVRVAPGPPVQTLAVALGDVHAAQITHAPVDHHDLAVIAEVRIRRNKRKIDGQEGLDTDAGLLELTEEFLAEKIGQVIVLHTHLHPLANLALQQFRHLSAHRIVLKLEELEVDVVARLLHVGHQVGQHRIETIVNPVGIAGQWHPLFQMLLQGIDFLVEF